MTTGAVGLALVVLAMGCSSSGPQTAATTTVPRTAVKVLANNRIESQVRKLEEAFEAENPDLDLDIRYGLSEELASDVANGSAEMLIDTPAAIASAVTNPIGGSVEVALGADRLVLIVPLGNSANVTGLSAYADRQRRMGLCADFALCGGASKEALTAAGVTPVNPTVLPDPTILATDVAFGKLDGALVFQTDIGDRLDVTRLPVEPMDAEINYAARRLRSSFGSIRLEQFLNESAKANEVLATAGLRVPQQGS
jgi:ABC-type molybdate transport system substrate-binding protein